MSSLLNSSVAFSGASASDLLRSSSNGVNGIPLKTLGRARFSPGRKPFRITAKLRKGKKIERPWPDNPDPNVKGGILSYLSSFKPLKEKPKPVILEFEKPLVELKLKIDDVQRMANETGLDFTGQIVTLENKYRQAMRDVYANLTAIQRVSIARHPNRPTFLDHVFNITDKFVELHGDRGGYDDPAIVTGIGSIDGRRYMFMGHQKGRNTKENIQRNFGMPTPHGYRKALRMMYYADHHGFPIVTFIDTPGAYADLRSEELGQGEAIAHNLRTMFGLKVPIISIVIGEGGSGGALAIGCGNKLLMLENSVFYVASPEACAAILYKSAKRSDKAAEQLKITADQLCKLQIADGIIPEPLSGAHADPEWTSQQIKKAINQHMDELEKLNTGELLKHRLLKFRKIGGFQEGVPLDPRITRNMKKRDEPIFSPSKKKELEEEVEKLKQQIVRATDESPDGLSSMRLDEMIDKLDMEVQKEYYEAAKSLGLETMLGQLRAEVLKRNSEGQPMQPETMDKIAELKDEFNRYLPTAPNYEALQTKLGMLKDLSETKRLSLKNKANASKQEIMNRFQEIIDRPDIKERMEAIKSAIKNSGVSNFADLDQELKDRIVNTKEEIEAEITNHLKLLGLDVKAVIPMVEFLGRRSTSSLQDLKDRKELLDQEINERIEEVVSTPEVKNMIELLKQEIAKAGVMPDETSRKKIEAREQQIKQKISEALKNSTELMAKHDQLMQEITEMLELSREPRDQEGENYGNDAAEVRASLGANHIVV